MARKKHIEEDESSSSESEISKPNKSAKKIEDDSSSSEDESVDEHDIDSTIDPVQMVKADYKFPLDVKLQLVNLINEHNKRKTVSFKIALKYLDWSAIKIDGYEAKELKACLAEIIKPVCTIRTLEEMLNDYKLNHEKYDLKMHPDAPKLPRNAVMKFIDDNRAKFKKALEKEFPGTNIGLKEISSYGAKKYAALPEREKIKYQNQYKEQLQVYAEKKKELLKANPELVKKRSASKGASGTIKKAAKPKKELTYITPFMVFREELEKEGKVVKFLEAQAMYKNMPDEEKLKYIQKLALMDTPLEKQYSSNERKISKNSNSGPPKPMSAYNRFVREYCSERKQDKDIKVMISCSGLWKSMSAEEKKVYEDAYKKELEIWHEKMQDWIKSLPIEHRVEQMAKYGLLTKVESNKKRKHDSVLNVSENHAEITTSTPAKKQKPIVNDSILSIKEEKIGKNDQVIKFVESPKKKQKEPVEEPTPKKKKFQEVIASFGPYPSLTTAHYFMTQKYSGKPHKVAKAYGKLSKEQKKLLYHDMKNIKDAYFVKLKRYAEENSKDTEKIKKFHGDSRKEQESSIDWHKGGQTDQSDSDSSDTDSDSS